MQNHHATGIGLDASGVTVDAGHHLIIQSQYDRRLPGASPEQI
jgi:hypothetical protein